MIGIDERFEVPPYSLAHDDKTAYLLEGLTELTHHHYHHCPPYRKIVDALKFDFRTGDRMEAIPFIPVRLFKEYELLSVNRADVVKTMTSSGTTGQQVSKILLDRITSTNQTKVLAKIVSNFIGNKRLPMLVIDTRAVVKDRNLFSARGAGILGFSMLGYDVTYALDEQMNIDFEAVEAFLSKHQGEKIMLFGFTFMIWEHFYRALSRSGFVLPLSQAVMIHGGGWKKLEEQAVDNETFKQRLREVCGVTQVYNYYGMVEQTGSIFMECEAGHLHTSVYSDIIIRDHRDFSVLAPGQKGLTQLLSLLPYSYPGHSILSEDMGNCWGRTIVLVEEWGNISPFTVVLKMQK